MTSVRTMNRIVSRADHFETDAARELRLRAAAKVVADADQVATDDGPTDITGSIDDREATIGLSLCIETAIEEEEADR